MGNRFFGLALIPALMLLPASVLAQAKPPSSTFQNLSILGFGKLSNIQPVDLTYAGIKNPNAIMFGAGNKVSFCPALSCLSGPPDGSVNPAYFDHQRTSFLVSAETQDDSHSEEQTLAVMTTVNKGFLRVYAANKVFSIGDNVALGNAVYRATKSGTTGQNSAPPSLTSSPTSLPLIVNDGTVVWEWINAAAIAGKVGIYNEIQAMNGGGNTWAQANNLQMQPGYLPRFITNTEMDITNNSGRDCDLGTSCLGLLFGIAGNNKITSAISITRHNPAGVGTIWGIRTEDKNLASESAIAIDSGSKYGISSNSLPGLIDLGYGSGNQFQQSFIYDNSTSPFGIQIEGTKSGAQIIGKNFYIDPSGRGYFEGATIRNGSNACIHSANAAGESIGCGLAIGAGTIGTAGSANKLALFGELNGTAYGMGVSQGSLDYVVPSGQLHTFYSAGSTVSSFKIGQSGPIEPLGITPASSSSPCTTGQHAWDQSFEYRCVATNVWKRAALSTW